MKKVLLTVIATVAALAALAAVVIGAGVYNVAADEPHSGFVYSVLETARDRSIAMRAADIEVPDLDDAARVRRGAGNYDAMCASCHLAPGVPGSDLSAGLNPAPPNLARAADIDPARAFWVVKHGIKASGMPAWGDHMDDKYIWDMVALLRQLPTWSPEQYAAEVEASGGHSHGEAEAGEHSHDDAESAGHSHEQDEQTSAEPSNPQVHTHADGKQHVHEARAAAGTPVAVAKTLHDALSAGDRDKVQALLDPSVLILESGNAERSREEYAAHHLGGDLAFSKATKYQLQRQTGDTVGDLAWVASEARLTGNRDGKPIDVASVETLVLRKSAAGWKIVHIHWSARSLVKA